MISALQLSSRSVAFWQWWTAELIDLWAIVVGAVAPGWRTEIAVAITPGNLKFVMGGHTVLEVPRIKLNAGWSAEEKGKIEGLLQQCKSIRLDYPAAEAFRYRGVMPLAVSSYLLNAIALQLPKWMPLKAGALLTDYRVIRRDVDAGTIEIEVAALKRAEVEWLVAQVRSLGFRIKRIGLMDADDRDRMFSFSVGKTAQLRPSANRAERLLLAAAAVLGCAILVSGAIEGFRSHRTLALTTQTTHMAASEAAVRRQEVIERIEPLQVLSTLEASPSSSELILQLSQLVPDDSWLTTFERRDRQIRIVGLSPDAAGIVKRVATSALLSEVSLRSSMSAGIGTGLDRFEIAAEFKSASP